MNEILQLNSEQYEFVEASDADKFQNCACAAHCFIYSLNPSRVVNNFVSSGEVLMQMRCDGTLGFAGGFVDTGENVTEGLFRELREEINLDINKYNISSLSNLVTFFSKKKDILLYFYSLKVSHGELKVIERRALDAIEYGHEVFGTFRVPLFLSPNGYGLPNFLTNRFIGNSKIQLLYALLTCKICSEDEVKTTIDIYKKIISNK